MVHFSFWFIMMEFVVKHYSNATPDRTSNATVDRTSNAPDDWTSNAAMKNKDLKAEVQKETRPKCWGGLVAHLAAFAAISCFLQLQEYLHESFGDNGWIGVWVTPVLASVIIGSMIG